MNRPLVIWLDDVGRESVSLVGGKSANLGELRRIGAPVPDGFAITAEAHAKFLDETGVAKEIRPTLNKISKKINKIAEYKEVNNLVNQIINGKELPDDIREAIVTLYKVMCQRCDDPNLAIAVRSSGLAEDMEDASFAGQYESYLNVRGEEELIKKTIQCWASQFTVRAMTYRHQKHLPIEGDLMGVTVLQMVNARSSGVGFTADPLTGDTSNIVLEGSWGLGESIVQGLVTPDRYVLNKNTLVLTEKTISEKDKLMRYAEQGIQEDTVPLEKRQISCLSDEEAIQLAELGKLLEQKYGKPQDFEWVVDSSASFPGNIYLVQTRPITVLFSKSEKEKAEYLADLMIHMFRQLRAQR